MKLNELALIGVAAATIVSCSPAKKEYASYELYPVRSGDLTEMEYTPEVTNFTLWAPTADEAVLALEEYAVHRVAATEAWDADAQVDHVAVLQLLGDALGNKALDLRLFHYAFPPSTM